MDILNSACCRVKGVELVAGDILGDSFPSIAWKMVTMPDGSVVTLKSLALMRAMGPAMREALHGLKGVR